MQRLHGGFETMAPIVAHRPGEGWVLLAGERRWSAMCRAGVPLMAYIARGWDDFLTWMVLDFQHPGARSMNAVDAAHMSIKATELLHPKRFSYPDETLAAYLQVEVDDMRATRSLITNWMTPSAPDEIQNEAAQQLREIAAGAVRPWSAHERMKRMYNRLNAVPLPVGKQRSILGNAASMCEGLNDALKSLGPISDELEADELEAAIQKLSTGRRALERVIRGLKERRAAR